MNCKKTISRTISRVVVIMLLLTATLVSMPKDTVYAADPWIKVGLNYGSTSKTSSTLQSSTGFTIGTVLENGVTGDIIHLTGDTKLTIEISGSNVIAKTTAGMSFNLGANRYISSYTRAQNGLISCNSSNYRGTLIFAKNSGSNFKIINYLSLENYLYGVIHSEMSQSNPIEALKAQAVVARSYAEVQGSRHNSDGFDVCTSTHCQVYKGHVNEYTKTVQAVNDTRGQKIYYGGKVVAAYYSANSGGHTQNSEDVWSSTVGYLRGVKDEFSPSYPWEYSISFSSLKTLLDGKGYNTGAIQSVKISKRANTGHAYTLTIQGATKTVTLNRESIRTTLGASNIKSLMFALGTYPNTPTVENNYYAIQKDAVTSKLGKTVSVLSANGQTNSVNLGDLYLQTSYSLSKFSLGGSSDPNDKAVTTSPLTIKGYGWGHGVGMPQQSAIQMAKQGYTYQQILHKYYTNIEVKE